MRKKLLLVKLILTTASAKLGSPTEQDSISVFDTPKLWEGPEGSVSCNQGLPGDTFPSTHQAVLESPQFRPNKPIPEAQTVPLPHENPTKSFWLDTPGANPLADEGSTGELTQDADVCIIGSGITGVSSAWHLTNMLGGELETRRRSVVILEARRFCSGATGRNGGHLTRNIFNAFHILETRYNTSEAIKSFDLEAHTANAIVKFITDRGLESEVDLVQGGHVSVFATKEEEVAARRDWEGVRKARREVAGEEDDGNDDLEGVEWIDIEGMHKRFAIDPKRNYSGARFIGHNLWPCKFVTQLYKDIENISSSNSNKVDVSLHTKTPVTSIASINPSSQDDVEPSSNRRWELHTPRGNVACNFVVHATNGYAGHLLPFISGASITDPEFGTNSFNGAVSSPSSAGGAALPRGAYGIKPTRGQVGAVRASVNASTFGWVESWDDGAEGWNYWFPRFQDTQSEHKPPLIILGGERRSAGGNLEVGNADDSTINPGVSRMLRTFLPGFYEGKFDEDGDGWEMEWTGVMAYTKTGDPFVGPVLNPLKWHTSIYSNTTNDSEGLYEGQYIAAGYSGHGMPRAYACAEAVSGMIAANIKRETWTRPAWLPERYLTWATEP